MASENVEWMFDPFSAREDYALWDFIRSGEVVSAINRSNCFDGLLIFVHMLPSLSLFVGGLLILGCMKLWKAHGNEPEEQGCKKPRQMTKWRRRIRYDMALLKKIVQWLLSAKSKTGRVITVVIFMLNMLSLCIYFSICLSLEAFCINDRNITLTVDAILNMFYLLYFGLRFIAADDTLRFWIDLNSIIDFFTIPTVFISYQLHSNIVGLRFLRALGLLELPNILQFLNLTRKRNAHRLFYFLAAFLSIWITAAGFVHLLENSGDPWLGGSNAHALSYLECLYFSLVTMGTIGYGDLSTTTTLGRIFLMFFILGGLAFYATFVPEIMGIIGSFKQYYRSSYKAQDTRRHVVICGYITDTSVRDFMRDYFHHNRGHVNTQILFLEQIEPSLELEAVFKYNKMYATFFHGSVRKLKDLRRVKMESASACLIMANQFSANPDEEDAGNILRAIGVKNYCSQTKIIIQLCQAQSKAHLQNLSIWNWRLGDSVICFAELKLGFMAQSCLVPGAATLLTNLFIMQDNTNRERGLWQDLYWDGMENMVMTNGLSREFDGKSFSAAAEICFQKLNIILFAIEYKTGSGKHSTSAILINPPPEIHLRTNMMGFFIGKHLSDVRRAGYYCHECHGKYLSPRQMKKCKCPSHDLRMSESEHCVPEIPIEEDSDAEEIPPTSSRSLGILPKSNKVWYVCKSGNIKDQPTLDSTGLFHWCKPRPIEDVILDRKEVSKLNLENHIVVGVFGNADSMLIRLLNFVMPLRASNLVYEELKYIVFVGSLEYMEREWKYIHNFPKLGVLPGSLMSNADMVAVSIEHCSMCAILGSLTANSDEGLEDASCILATLLIRSKQLRHIHIVKTPLKMETETKDSPKPNPQQTPATTEQIKTPVKTETATKDPPKSTPAATDHIPGILKPDTATKDAPKKHTWQIPTITELKHSMNVKYLGIFHPNIRRPKKKLHATKLFASGKVFSGGFLDSLMSTGCYNHHVLALLQTLVSGGITPDLEETLAKENALIGSSSKEVLVIERDRCKFSLIPLNEDLTEGYVETTFGRVFSKALLSSGILCFGLYRLFPEPNLDMSRFVITKPHRDFPLLPTDMLYAMVPFKDLQCRKMSMPTEGDSPTCVVKKVPSEHIFQRFKLRHPNWRSSSKERKQGSPENKKESK